MATLKDYAKTYVGEQTKNIADLPEVDIDFELRDGERKDKEGTVFKYKYISVNGEEYRIPGKVIGDIKAIIEKKPNLKKIAVTKKGTGLNTQYTVISLD